MRRLFLIAVLLVSTCCALAQQVETSRFEVDRWGNAQGFRFVSFNDQGGLVAVETERTNEERQRLWEFITLDTNLYELRKDLIALPDHYILFDAKSSPQWAVFVFLDDNQHRSDSVALRVVTYQRGMGEYDSFAGMLPQHSLVQSAALLEGTLMLSVNLRDGGGYLAQYDLARHSHRTITPAIGNDFILFQLVAVEEARRFVLAAREFVDRHYRATNFLVFSSEGALLRTHRFENGENAGLGRMCFGFDRRQQLTVYATLEREINRRVTVEGMTEDFSKEAVGVTWIKFAADSTRTKTYLFRNLPDIELALTSSDRLRVREEVLRMQQGKKKEPGEICFQFHTPRLVDFAGNHVFSVEAFQPVYHTETRMDYGYYGIYRTYPVSYTVFDGYDFFSEVLLAFNDDGELQWHNSVRFENALCNKLWPHATEAVAHDELLVASPEGHALRYEVFDTDGTQLLDQQTTPLDYLYATDQLDEEYKTEVVRWFGDRFLIQGSQRVQNPSLRNTRRTVFFVQKIQYD